MIFLDDLCTQEAYIRPLVGDTRKLRIHSDVVELVHTLILDEDKLRAAAPFIFFPSYDTWIEWEDASGHLGVYFFGPGHNVTSGEGFFAMKRFGDDQPSTMLPLGFDMPSYNLLPRPVKPGSQTLEEHIGQTSFAKSVRPFIYAVLALINSPKLIRSTEVDVSRINKKRQALGRYVFHPHHEVRLDIDKREIKTTAGHGDGASKALHFVRTHLRLVRGQYTLVRPHWRGDPALGIRDTHYRVDRRTSKWPT